MQFYTPIEIDQIEEDIPYLVETMDWVKNVIGKPHPKLGRTGSVCPFVPHSVRSNSISLTVMRCKNLTQQQILDNILHYREVFLKQEPREGMHALKNALLIIVPDITLEDAPRIIDENQKILKPIFVESGLMLGEFHNQTQTPGIHNPNFRPLRSPIPLFAIRYMIEGDILFLQDEDPRLRIKFLKAYLHYLECVYSQRFEQKIQDPAKLAIAYQLIEQAQKQLQEERMVHSDIAYL
jgi:hypothetical protein